MNLPSFISSATGQANLWKDLTHSVPTLAALAQLASDRLVTPTTTEIELSLEARTILSITRNRGVIELKSNNTEFESAQRMLAVYVEQSADTHVMFRSRIEPEITVKFLDGFRQLCDAGLVMHQVGGEFSLTSKGFEQAKAINPAEVSDSAAMGTVLSF
ncbi:MAG: hypothetical protein CMJ76_03745 [Planctomycetaceae bacterium]|nr:hypothetical protein [Planctomycetaceae bacterium]|tara:strand:+ start:735 stop:1211 length:477 start_codon:yes stop_codon:yes gene_type:complete